MDVKESYHRYSKEYWEKADENQKLKIAKEHQERAIKGKKVWNKWAEGLKDLTHCNFEIHFDNTVWGQSVSFDDFYFPVDTFFNNAVFKQNITFMQSIFEDYISLSLLFCKINGFIIFQNCKLNDCWFNGSSFSEARFDNVTFDLEADFSNCLFNKTLSIQKCTFELIVHFQNSKISSLNVSHVEAKWIQFSDSMLMNGTSFTQSKIDFVTFQNSRFRGEVNFNQMSFGDSYFSSSNFESKVSYKRAKFLGQTTFDFCLFESTVDFTEASFEGTLNLYQAVFLDIPDFNYCSYSQSPYISDMSIPWIKQSMKSFPYQFINDVNHRYRKLKLMAIDAGDHQQELKFFGYETRSKLYQENTPLLTKALIWLYWITSNFGQSIKRPALTFMAILTIYTFMTLIGEYKDELHLSQKDSISKISSKYCMNSNMTVGGAIVREKLRYSLLFFPVEKATIQRVNQCLYQSEIAPLSNTLINLSQFLLSSISLFLLGLGLRNRFKIK